jgi:hypothetical protein
MYEVGKTYVLNSPVLGRRGARRNSPLAKAWALYVCRYPMLRSDTYLGFSPEETLPMPWHHGAYSVGASIDMLWAYMHSKTPRNTVIGALCPADFGFLLVVHKVFFDNIVRDISIRIQVRKLCN